MPAGVGGNQPNDALTAARLLTATIDTHLVMSTLQRSGIAYVSAQQFTQGREVTDAADRMTLAKMLSVLLKIAGAQV
jgi:hypothetical protein